jgi:hypothetical protein
MTSCNPDSVIQVSKGTPWLVDVRGGKVLKNVALDPAILHLQPGLASWTPGYQCHDPNAVEAMRWPS